MSELDDRQLVNFEWERRATGKAWIDKGGSSMRCNPRPGTEERELCCRYEENMRKSLLVASLVVASMPLYAIAQDTHHATIQSDGLNLAAPAAYGQGAQIAVVKGDPTKQGMYVVRLKVPAGFKIPPHNHPNDENVTVLSGSFNIGTGDKLDETKGMLVKAGGYSYVAKGMSHYAWFTEETVLQLHGVGPQGITYVNPADDPRKK